MANENELHFAVSKQSAEPSAIVLGDFSSLLDTLSLLKISADKPNDLYRRLALRVLAQRIKGVAPASADKELAGTLNGASITLKFVGWTRLDSYLTCVEITTMPAEAVNHAAFASDELRYFTAVYIKGYVPHFMSHIVGVIRPGNEQTAHEIAVGLLTPILQHGAQYSDWPDQSWA